MTDSRLPILHHFEASPFSEKIRVIFGFKRIAWQSVLIPRIMPKPDLVPLTGGYRRTPVMQIGADIFCDTRIIQREIERRFPEPTLFPGNGGVPDMTGLWTDRIFFGSVVFLVFGSLGDKVPQDFIDDRTKLRGQPFDVKAMAAALPHHRDQFRSQAALIEAQLAHGGKFLLGEFSVADAGCYMNIWYVRSNLPELADELLAEFPRLRDWEQQVRILGHGTRAELSGQDALTIASKATPEARAPEATRDCERWRIGDVVKVSADEPVKTPIEGEIVSLSVHHIAIRRRDPDLGEVVVHFPRLGYVVSDA
ncbi:MULTISPECIES: glutathione S-transferase family protein [unclassified Bradyrhizobium]|uniref:glutathione S-transferase family protein n=1 Tax=unclassified Bradyrhizobium TaxID=2631580 RepID=UPI001BABFC6A|nr:MULTISPECIES: glutathione S-transferase family protein [unclassified Bradyrhizobium]MBR1229309.1 glutathione S-transferase family protein [Bradyrhizobium sp. AUGA SZCCT0176]MBR1300964.1 glutathione S-transferase family protein [Bradyrhizobium sp. AUGA SZCCT0042]